MIGSRGRDFGLGIDFNTKSFNGQINSRGTNVIHEIGLRCTCNSGDAPTSYVEQTHAMNRNRTLGCQLCMGDKVIFRDPKKIVGLITNIKENKISNEAGWLMPGDCVFSPKLGYIISAGDLITFMHVQPIPDGQVIVRGSTNISTNKTFVSNLEENEDRLNYHAHDGIWCEDEDGNTYQSNSDYSMDSSKIIKWIGARPDVGKRYTIKYRGYLEWIAFAPPVERIDRDTHLGQKVLLRKRHIAIINEDPRPRLNEKVTFKNRTSIR
jgi:hypothetical protein